MTATDSPTIDMSFEVIRSRLRDPEFLACHGLGNEAPFHVFPYNAANENEVRMHTDELVEEFSHQANTARVTHFDLWDVICGICDERGLMGKLEAFEERKGTEALLARLQTIASPAKIVSHMESRFRKENGEPEPGRDALIISGVGKAYPVVRAHQVLECAQPVFTNIPLVLLYPGIYDGQSLRLFGSISDGNYYRAFNLL